MLEQGTGVVPAGQSLPPAKGLSSVQVEQGQPFNFHVPEEQPGASNRTLLPAAPPPSPPPLAPTDEEQPGPSGLLPPPPPTPASLPGASITAAPPAQPLPLPGPQRVPRTTAFRKRKAAEAAAAGGAALPGSKTRRQTSQYTCSKCGQPKRLDTDHTRIAGVSYCATVGGKTVEDWREEMKRRPGNRGGGEGHFILLFYLYSFIYNIFIILKILIDNIVLE